MMIFLVQNESYSCKNGIKNYWINKPYQFYQRSNIQKPILLINISKSSVSYRRITIFHILRSERQRVKIISFFYNFNLKLNWDYFSIIIFNNSTTRRLVKITKKSDTLHSHSSNNNNNNKSSIIWHKHFKNLRSISKIISFSIFFCFILFYILYIFVVVIVSLLVVIV